MVILPNQFACDPQLHCAIDTAIADIVTLSS
jgi:hypothetical protein